jgi:hypothetical protein
LQKEANKEIRGSKKGSSEAKPMLRIKPQQKAARAKQIAALTPSNQLKNFD